MQPKEMLMSLVGKWEGTCKTWFEPAELADESQVVAEFSSLFDGRFMRHQYASEIQGKSRRGEELIAYNALTAAFQMAWIDDFHMNYAILFSEGVATDSGFAVLGQYDVGQGLPAWKWRTVYDLQNTDQLTITAYNISPEATEAKALETKYSRLS